MWDMFPALKPYRDHLLEGQHVGWKGPADAGAARVVLNYILIDMLGNVATGKMSPEESLKWGEGQPQGDLRRMTRVARRHQQHRLALCVLLVALPVFAYGSPSPAEAQEAAISGTITLDPSLKGRLPKEPLLLIVASKSPDPKKPPIVVKRIPGVVLPYEYKLTEEDITLVGSTFEGKLYVTARIEPGRSAGLWPTRRGPSQEPRGCRHEHAWTSGSRRLTGTP